MNVERVTVECDERGFELHLLVDEDPTVTDEGQMILNIQMVAEELWDEMVAKVGPWVLEKAAAERDYRNGRANLDEDLGQEPGENAHDYWKRTGDAGPLLEMADHLRKRAKEEAI
jgi:hypothetical protein